MSNKGVRTNGVQEHTVQNLCNLGMHLMKDFPGGLDGKASLLVHIVTGEKNLKTTVAETEFINRPDKIEDY